MCIRDRVNGEAENGDHDLFRVVENIPWIKSDEAPQIYTKACLLYTSDAADERSSVDLGGRRIIKKKKQDLDVHDSDL